MKSIFDVARERGLDQRDLARMVRGAMVRAGVNPDDYSDLNGEPKAGMNCVQWAEANAEDVFLVAALKNW